MFKRIYLEITNACNLNCRFCTNPKGNKFLSLKEIKDVLLQVKPYCNYIYLHILGEPTLHPDFNEILDMLDKYDFNLQLVTNGTLLHNCPDILEHKCLRKLSISLHSVGGLEIENHYFNTIEELIDNNRNVFIELRNYLDNDEKVTTFVNTLINKYKLDETAKKNSYMLKENVYLYSEDIFRWPNINDPVISNVGTCHGAIDMLAINSNLDVTLCCLDPYAFNSIGNLKEKSFSDIIQTDEYKTIINEFKKHIISKDLCAKCSYRLRFEKNSN